ncbi:MAG: phenylacetate--CoA ligase family protein [Dehalococcoidia bacterium]|nr:phenylacetate--CoA ligase family protein [Dehalococcoidia bacterium]
MSRNVSASRALKRLVLAPALDLLRGTHTMRCLKELEESQWWPQERIEQLQSERLQRLIHHAYERVPHYRRLMDACGVSPDSIRTAADLSLLPVLTKEDVREHCGELLAEGFPRGELLHGRTSGSTGTPLAFYSSRENRWSHGYARSLRALAWAGVYPGDPVLHIAGRRRDGFVEEAPFNRLVRFLSRDAFENPVDFSDSSLRRVVDRVAALRPHALRGYASAVCIIAEFIRDSGLQAPEVGAIVTGGEQLLDVQRALLRDVFGTEPFSKYSSFENYDIAMECDAHAGMHVAAEDLVVEVVDDEGKPLEPGRLGRVLVTNLHEYGFPLIRYDTADESSFVMGVCACGRSLPRLSAVVGRVGSAIYTPSGKRLSTNTLDSSGLVSLGIRQFQLVQERIDHVTVRVVTNSILSSRDAQTLITSVSAEFRGWIGDDVLVEVAIVDRVELTSAGKHLYLISEVKRPVGREFS